MEKRYFTLANGVEIPALGFGTWQIPEGCCAYSAVHLALDFGYRHVDTAACYGNENGVGRAVKSGNLPREQVFVTSKVWNTDRGYRSTLAACDKSLKTLGLDYLDLYLIHWPANARQFPNWEEINLETWRAMTDLYRAGRVRSIGVSNFLPHHLEPLMITEVKPMVDQIEFHPGMNQTETLRYCQKAGILVEAWSPLGSGRVLGDGRLKEIAGKYGKSVAQVCLRWVLQHGALPLPKSCTPSRIKDNLDVFDFRICQEDMKTIDSLPPFGGSGLHPDTINF